MFYVEISVCVGSDIYLELVGDSCSPLTLWVLGLKSGLQFNFKGNVVKLGCSPPSQQSCFLIIHHSWKTVSGPWSPAVQISHLRFPGDTAVPWLPGCCLLSFVSFRKHSWTGFDLTLRHKWWCRFISWPRSQWFCSWALTIIGVMCGWCPSGRAASLNGWRRVTGCRGDALLMREPD